MDPIISFSEQITNEDQKQNLNLTAFSWNIIESDIVNFSADIHSPLNLATFLNKIIINCEENPELLSYPCNISSIANEKQKKFSSLLSMHLSDTERTNLKKDLLLGLMSDYEKELIQKNDKHRLKGIAKKFRLSNKAYNLLCSIPSDDFKTSIFKKPGTYLKVLFEEYSMLPTSEREKIFFIDIVQKIERAIAQKQELLITSGQYRFDMIPYKITTDAYLSHLYLAGKSCIHPAEGASSFTASSFRISRIISLSMLGASDHPLDKKDKKELDKRISAQDIQFLLSDSINIKLRFTKEGVQKYQSQSYLRPSYAKKSANDIYEFQLTALQAFAYFFKFGKDVEILEPANLRTYFKHEYESAVNIYFS